MDKEVLKCRLRELSEAAIEKAMHVVQESPEGQWIAASEWRVREIFAQLTRECYQQMLQAKSDEHWTAQRADFSPVRRRRSIEEQGATSASGVDGRRRG